jgi:hypothetical protein
LKKLLFTLFLASFLTGFAQDNTLFSYNWKLEKIATATDTLIAQPYTSVPTDPPEYEQIHFNEFDGYYSFMFGYYGNGIAEDLVFDDTIPEFTISYFYNHLGGMSPSEGYFTNNFIMDHNYQSILNPFKYSFRYENNYVYLDIENNEGSIATFFDDVLSTDEFLAKDFNIYPNPATDFISIESEHTTIEKVVVVDLNGKVVLKDESLQLKNINISNLKQGVYILKIYTSTGKATQKFIKN